MKKLIFILTSLFPIYTIYAQVTDSVRIIAIDNLGIRDTVVFGFAIGSTTGLDTAFGEQDISSEKLSELDIRLIQRTTLTFDTFWLDENCAGDIKPFAQNLDLKKDFRPPNGLLNDHFILSIYGVNYPITIKVLEIYTDYEVPYCIYDENSRFVSGSELHDLIERSETDTIIYIEDSSQCKYISFRPWVILNTPEQFKNGNIKLFPNPGTYYIKIQITGNAQKKLQILDILGNTIEVISVEGYNYYLDISDYSPGEYFITNNFTTKKFIKK